MSLLVRPSTVELSVAVPEGVAVTRLVVGPGVHLREAVTGLSRVLVKLDVYGDVIVEQAGLPYSGGVAVYSVSCHSYVWLI